MQVELQESARRLIGDSPRMRHVHRQIERLGKTRWPALVLGETGTGKEMVARAIYASNPAGPFVTIDCSAIVSTLAESELFGHQKGSFSGAMNSKLGLIEMAHGGTAFFDEIGELPLDMQAKLLRVLQEKEFRPVGSLQARRADFRVIAATNRDLEREVEKGTFRRDLFYRLNVVTIRLAPLRERREDIPYLVEHFLARYGARYELTPDTLAALSEYDWPGNVRELEHTIQHMVALNSGPILHQRDLPSQMLNRMREREYQEQQTQQTMAMAAAVGARGAVAPNGPPAPDARPTDPPVLPLPEVEKRAILSALRYAKGDRTVAASLLGIGRTTLYRKLKEYDAQGAAARPADRDAVE